MIQRSLSHLWRCLFLALFPVVLLAFHGLTSHTIVYKDIFFAIVVVWILAWRWLSLEGWQAADRDARYRGWRKLHVGAVLGLAVIMIYLVALDASQGAQEPGAREMAQDLLMATLILLLCVPLLQRLSQSPARVLLWPLGGWCLALVITALAARDPVMGAHTLHRYVAVLAVTVTGLDLLRERMNLRLLSGVLVGVVGVLSVYGLFQSVEMDFFAWKTWADGPDQERRIAGALGNPNFFAGFLAGSLPFCMGVAVACRRGWSGALTCVVVVLGLWSLYRTGSQGGLAGFGIGIFAFVALACLVSWRDRWKEPRWRKRALGVASGLAVVGIIVGVVGLIQFMKFLEAHEDRMISFQSRRWMWVGAARMFAAEPLTGMGLGNFAELFPDYRPVELSEYKPPDRYRVDHPHSEWLEIASEMGLVGFLAFVWLVVAFGAVGSRALLVLEDRFRRWVILGALAGIAAMLGHGLVSVHLRWITSLLLFATLLAIAGSGVFLTKREDGKRKAGRGPLFPVLERPRLLLIGAGILAMSAAMLYHFTLLYADFYHATGRGLLRDGRPALAATFFQKSLQLNPRSNDTRYFLGSAYYDNNMYPQALDQYDAVLRHGRNFVHVYFNKATILQKMGEFDKAVEIYQKSLENDPNYARLHDYLGRAYYQMAREQNDAEEKERYADLALAELKRAAELYGETVDKAPWDATLHKDYGISLLLIGEYERARYELSEAVRINPELETASRFLEHAEQIEELARVEGPERVRELLFGRL